MGQQASTEQILVAWRALANGHDGQGWRTIPVKVNLPCPVMAGRCFPGGEEALLIGFDSVSPPHREQMPSGRGFTVRLEDIEVGAARQRWFSLHRLAAGNLQMFATMVTDVLATLEREAALREAGLFQAFLRRVKAWQSFMQRDQEGALSPEEEVGLFGELLFMERLAGTRLDRMAIVQAWMGPLDALQDFQFERGAIEVKASLDTGRFPATVSNLDQFDDGIRSPLFLAAVRLRLSDTGLTLAGQVDALKALLADDPTALAAFENRLLQAGYVEAQAGLYVRRFSPVDERLFHVHGDFPRLARRSLTSAILDARYRIDIDLVPAVYEIGLTGALSLIGAE